WARPKTPRAGSPPPVWLQKSDSRLLELVPDVEGDPAVGQTADVRDEHVEPAAERALARRRRVRGERIVRRAGERDGAEVPPRAVRPFDPVGPLNEQLLNRVTRQDPPDQKPFRRQVRVKPLLPAVFQEEVLAPVGPADDLQTLSRVVLDRGEDDL